MDELELIREYAAVFGKGTNYHYYIFSKGGFTDGLLQAQERGEVPGKDSKEPSKNKKDEKVSEKKANAEKKEKTSEKKADLEKKEAAPEKKVEKKNKKESTKIK